MEIVTGENACHMRLAFVSIKMEVHWRTSPIGKVRINLPFLKKMAVNNFTQMKLPAAPHAGSPLRSDKLQGILAKANKGLLYFVNLA